VANILVIDDDPFVCESLLNVFQKLGHRGLTAHTLAEARKLAPANSLDLIFCDIRLPDGQGLEILTEIQKAAHPPEIIVITGFGNPDEAELAIKSGAWDYVQKPLSVNEVRLTIERALQYRGKKQSTVRNLALDRNGIIGNSPLLKPCLDFLAQAGASEANVLISGETGTGKELFARAIHRNSARASFNFVILDCAALPETLVESTLFGHVRGAYTGADRASDGLVKQADKGTLFLDEVGELSLSVQKAFLRVLQEKRFRPVGGNHEVNSDFRLITATNRDLEAMVKKGLFREDLLFRLRTLSLELPPLRKLKDDLKDLVLYYTAKFCDQYNLPMKGFSPDFIPTLLSYDWPGNVRELIQALEKAIITAEDAPTLFPRHLPQHIRIHLARNSVNQNGASLSGSGALSRASESLLRLAEAREAWLSDLERDYLMKLARTCAGDVSRACEVSGLSRSRLYALMKKHQIHFSR